MSQAFRGLLLLLLSVLLLHSLVACTDYAPTTVTVIPHTSSPLTAETPPDPCFVLNIASQTIHRDTACRHVLSAKTSNLRYAATDTETVNTLLAMGYRFCTTCSD